MTPDERAKIDEFFKKHGIESEQTFTVIRGIPTPDQERAGNVIGGVSSMDEALSRIAARSRRKAKPDPE